MLITDKANGNDGLLLFTQFIYRSMMYIWILIFLITIMSLSLKDIYSECVYQDILFTDHESRHNATNNTEEERPESSENSPLIQQLPPYRYTRSSSTLIIVTILLIILITGVIIGIYLLVVQSESGKYFILHTTLISRLIVSNYFITKFTIEVINIVWTIYLLNAV